MPSSSVFNHNHLIVSLQLSLSLCLSLVSFSLSLRMEYADIDKTTRPLAVPCIPFSSSSPSSSRFSPPSTAFQGPCAACRFLRRRCNESCILAPYFPPNEPLKFINAHKVFGASNIVKALQVIPTILIFQFEL